MNRDLIVWGKGWEKGAKECKKRTMGKYQSAILRIRRAVHVTSNSLATPPPRSGHTELCVSQEPKMVIERPVYDLEQCGNRIISLKTKRPEGEERFEENQTGVYPPQNSS
jgi:hypothetical protein